MTENRTLITAPMRGIPTPAVGRVVPEAHLARIAELTGRVAAFFGTSGNQTPGDFETCTEELFRADAVLEAYGPENLEVLDRRNPGRDVDFDGRPFFFSLWTTAPFVSDQARAAERWDQVEAVRNLAGRPITHADADRESLLAAVRRMSGHSADGSVWIKDMSEAKAGLWRVVLQEDSYLGLATHPLDRGAHLVEQGYDPVEDGLGMTLIRREGDRGAFMVAAHVPMCHEYRIFVVDGVPVSGAGCIEEHTPLDRVPGSGPFSTLTRADRRDDDEVPEHRYGTVRTMIEAARPIAAALAEAGAPHCVVDMAVTDEAAVTDQAVGSASQRPVLVEVNTIENAGLYASDPYTVARAMARSKNPQRLRDRGFRAAVPTFID